MKIGFATCDWSQTIYDEWGNPAPGGSNFARISMPGARLAHRGRHDCVIGQIVSAELRQDDRPDEHRRFVGVQPYVTKSNHLGYPGDMPGIEHHGLDLLIMQRWMNAGLIDAIEQHKANGGCPIINDVDDWFWGLDTRNNAFKATHPKHSPEVNRNHYARILALSDCVTVSTPYLAERLAPMLDGVRIEVVQNAIDLERYTPKRGDDAKGSRPTIGWVGAMPWRSGDLETVASLVAQVCNDNELTFHHAGVVMGDETADRILHELAAQRDTGTPINIKVDGAQLTDEQIQQVVDHERWFANAGQLMGCKQFTFEPMRSIYEYPQMFEQIDVGIVPLSDRPFNMAKSWIKGTEYAAAGVPFIAQASPEYCRLYDDYGIGRIARKPKDWLRELRKMLDADWRAEQREQNLERVAQLDIELHWRRWQDVYRSVVAEHN